MIATTWRDRVFNIPALMTDIDHCSEDGANDVTSVSLVNRTGSWHAVSWPSLQLPSELEPFTVCEATVLEVREDVDCEPIALVHWRSLDSTRMFDLIPNSLSPIPSTVLQTCDLIKSIELHSLRSLMADVMRTPGVYANFWTCPASLGHHHSNTGGLAQHSLEVAVAAASVRGLDSWQRDITVLYALLHDIGKIWSYSNGRLTDEARRIGHEAIGYRALQPALASLREVDEKSEATLGALLSSTWKRTCRHPAAALGEIVRAMDRFSAARGVGNAPCGYSEEQSDHWQ